ncbi:hypothetical protein [Mycolicibacterium goodii]|uniref:Proline rich protein n=1 Tax=Mycolicibacterium goodii TaxID=134601 RepID=A0A0K0X0Z3_MYCGD|nr:hypothetical protein AFA91_03480 [Mycolicibacterium goodii]
MSETQSDHPTTPVETTPASTTDNPPPPPAAAAPVVAPPPEPRRHSRLVQAAAWVGIVAGVVFIVAVVFGTGFVLGKNSGPGHHHRGHDRPHVMMFHRGGPPPMMPGMGGGPGQFGPSGPVVMPGDDDDVFRGPSAPERPETPNTAPARP